MICLSSTYVPPHPLSRPPKAHPPQPVATMLQYRLYGGHSLPPNLEGFVKAGANIGSVIGQFAFGTSSHSPHARVTIREARSAFRRPRATFCAAYGVYV